MLHEFKEFVNKGNALDLAVGVVLGAAFGAVVSSLVDRVLLPLIGLVFGTPNFDAIGRFGCGSVADGTGAVVETCAGSAGAVITALVNFLLVGVALFFVVKAYNAFQREQEEPKPEKEPVADPEDVVLLREIRDALTRR